MARRPSVGIRMDVLGKSEVLAALRETGREGDVMARRIERSGPRASRGLLAVDAAARSVRGSLTNVARQAGPAGAALESFGSKGLIAAAGIGAIALAATAAISKAKSATREIAAIGDAADRVGIAAGTFEQLTAAVVNSGQKTEGLEASLSKYLRTLAEARDGNKAALETFGALGLNIASLTAAGESNEQILLRVADAFKAIEDPAERARLGQKLFEEGGRALVPVLSQGADELNRLFAEADAVGQLYGGELIRNSQALSAELDRQGQIIDTQLNTAFAALTPMALDLATAFATVAVRVAQAFEGLKGIFNLSNDPNLLRGRLVSIQKELDGVDQRLQRRLDIAGDNTERVKKLLSQAAADIDRLEAERRDVTQRLKDATPREATSVGEIKLPAVTLPSVTPSGGGAGGSGGARRSQADLDLERRAREVDELFRVFQRWQEQGIKDQERYTAQVQRERDEQLQAWEDLRKKGVGDALTALGELALGMRSGRDVLTQILGQLATDLPALLFGGQASTGLGAVVQQALGGIGSGLISELGVDSFIGDLFGTSSLSFASTGTFLQGDFFGGLPLFNTGGAFEVTPSTSLGRIPARSGDDQLVGFRAQVGETVTVTPRGKSPGTGATIYVPITVEGDATDDTVERFRRVAREEINAAAPQLISQAVSVTEQEISNNPDFGQ